MPARIRSDAGYCPKCGVVKALTAFFGGEGKTYPRSSYCKPCMRIRAKARWKKGARAWRNYFLQRRYGITEQAYALMEAEQQGLCRICGKKDSKRLSVDHNHTTGKIRGLLCRRCNSALGLLGESPERCLQAATYLREAGE